MHTSRNGGSFKIVLIVAMAKNRVIGHQGQLPWHLPEDLKRFRELTLHHRVVMGRKTFESIGKPLPRRENVVITRTLSNQLADGVQVVHSLVAAFELPFLGEEIKRDAVFVIGGGEIYQQALPYADVVYLTEIDLELDGDTYFSCLEAEDWEEVERVPGGGGQGAADSSIKYAFITYRRR